MNIKKCIALIISIIMMVSTTCSAARVRLCDVGLNDFVSYYNRIAKMAYEQDQKYNYRLNQSPFKNLTLSDSNYTAYSCTVGKEKNNIVTLTFYVNKSGYVSYLNIAGNTKKNKQEQLLGGVLGFCLMSCGVDIETISSGQIPDDLFWFNGTEGKIWAQTKNRYIHVKSNRIVSNIPSSAKYNPFIVEVYATND